MAQLKDLLVSGPSRLIGKLFANEVQLTTLNIPTASNGTTYGPGTSGQALVSNGTSAYWKTITIADIGGSDVLGVAKGGTGNTVATQGGIVYGNGTTYALTAAGSSGQVLQSAGTGTPTWITATNSNTASTIVKRDASGNFSAGTITATLSGNASSATKLGSSNVGNSTQPIYLEGGTPKAATAYSAAAVLSASKFTAAQSVTLTGDVTGTASSVAGWSVATTLATQSGVTGGSYGLSADASPAHGGKFKVPYVTVNTKGLVTGIAEKEITLPTDNNTDTNVSQTITTTDSDYRILFSGTADDTTRTEGSRKGTNLRYNPSTSELKMVNGTLWIQGGSNAGSSSATNRLTLTSGMPANLAYNTSKRGTRIYSNGIAFADPYNGNSNNDSGWIRQIEETANSGVLEIATGDDSNESIVVRQYNTSSAVASEITLLNASHQTLLNTTLPRANNTYDLGSSSVKWKTVYAATFDGTATNATTAAKLGTNAGSSTQPVYFTNGVPTAITGDIANGTTGNAATATKFASSQTIKLTGDVTGEVSSQAGWTIATTLANSGVTATSYGPASNASPAHGGNFTVPYITVDAKGRITAASTKTITLPSDNNTDTLVTQTNTTGDASYRLLLSESANDTTETKTARKSTKLQFNPSSGKLTLSGGAHINQAYTGTATAAANNNGTYTPAKWTFNLGFNPVTGDTIIIKVPGAGHDYGVFLSTDNGANYHPIRVWASNGRLSTHYAAGSYIELTYDSTQVTDYVYAAGGATARSNITGSWNVVSYYDANTTRVWNLYKCYGNYTANNVIKRYQILFQGLRPNEKKLIALYETDNNTATGKTLLTSTEFDPLGEIFYYNSTGAYAATNTIDAGRLDWTALADLRFTFNITNDTSVPATTAFRGVAPNPLYLRVTINSATGGATVDTNQPLTSTLPTTADGKYYIYLGNVYDWYRVYLNREHPVYFHNGTKLTEYKGNTTTTNQLVLTGSTNATMTAASTNPKITFMENANTQPVHLIYTDQDSYRSPAGLKIIGGTSATPAWLEVEGTVYAAGFSGNATSATTASKLGSSTLGSTTQPIYLDSGTAKQCSVYAGGTAVTLNGTSKAANTASFYAPTASGTANQVLISGGANTAPSWTNQSNLSVGSASSATTATSAGKITTNGSNGQYWAMTSASAQGWKTTTVSNEWTGGTTSGPTIKTTVNGVAGTAVAIPSAGASASGVITTGTQTIAGAKTLLTTLTINGLKGTSNTDYGTTLPSSGTEGQLFFQISDEVYEIPAGGTTGQALIKNSNTDRDVKWGPVGGQQTPNNSVKFYPSGSTSTSANTGDAVFNTSVYVQNSVLFGAAWNDYAEYRETTTPVKAGRVVIENGDDTLSLSTERMQPGAEIVSDTFGFAIGQTEKSKTAIAAAGRVLAYPHEPRRTYRPGQPVCSGPNGTVSQMTDEEARMYPWCIIGTVSSIPEYDTWGEDNIKVDGRIWIRIR